MNYKLVPFPFFLLYFYLPSFGNKKLIKKNLTRANFASLPRSDETGLVYAILIKGKSTT